VIVGVATAAMAFSVWSILNQTTLYVGSFQLLIEPVNAENANLANPASEANRNTGASALDYDTQIAVLKSPELLSPEVIEELQETYPGISYNSLTNNLNIARLRETKILKVDYQGTDPGEVQLVLDTLSEIYLQYSLNERQTYLRQGIQFVDEQMPALQAQVNQLQDKLQFFRETYGFTDPEAQAEKLNSQATTLAQQRLDVEQALVQARSLSNTLQNEAGMVATLEQAPAYQQIVSQLRQIESEIALERVRFQEQSLKIQEMRRKRDNLLPLLRQEAERVLDARMAETANQIKTLEIQQQAIVVAEAELQQNIQKLPVLTREYTNLQRELEIATNSLTGFLETRQTLQIEAAQREIPWQLIQEASKFPTPIANNVNRSLMMAIVTSLLLGFAAALLLEKLDTTYHSAEELKEKIKLPVLGVIPLNPELADHTNGEFASQRKGRKRSLRKTIRKVLSAISRLSRPLNLPALLVDTDNHASEFMNALRVLHTNVQMIGRTRSVRSVVISSATPGDGKSTVALHWAKTAVAMGQRVLLIDTDLRQPQLHSKLQIPNEKGLSDFISNNLRPMSFIQQASPDEELYVLTSGQSPFDPASLLSSPKIRQLANEAHQFFDLVIYDAPPLLKLADANLLTQYADGLVLVVRLDKTDRYALKQVLENLKGFQISVLGAVANGQQSYDSASETV